MFKTLVCGALAALTLAAPAFARDGGHDRARHHGYGYEQHRERDADRQHWRARPPVARHRAPAASHYEPALHDSHGSSRRPREESRPHGGISIGLHLPL